jgi:mono/diheme cytochrome c family protein
MQVHLIIKLSNITMEIKSIKSSLLLLINLISLTLLFSLSGCYNDKAEILYPDSACDTAAVKYSTSILPVLGSNCNSCHGGSTPSAAIKLDTYAGVKQQVDNGRLWGAVSHATSYSPMPKNGNMLNTCNLARIRLWIAAGAPNN